MYDKSGLLWKCPCEVFLPASPIGRQSLHPDISTRMAFMLNTYTPLRKLYETLHPGLMRSGTALDEIVCLLSFSICGMGVGVIYPSRQSSQ